VNAQVLPEAMHQQFDQGDGSFRAALDPRANDPLSFGQDASKLPSLSCVNLDGVEIENHGMIDLSPLAEPISFLSFVGVFLQSVYKVHAGLGSFLRLSLQPCSRTVHRAAPSSDLWPCPMPSYRWTGPSKLSPRRRRRRKFVEARSCLLQHVIGVLNWESLGHPNKPPPEACVGFGYSDAQWDMVCRLERLVDHFLRAGPISAQSLGRSGEKFNRLLHAAQELPCVEEVDLFKLVSEFASDFDSYTHKRHKGDDPGLHRTTTASTMSSDEKFSEMVSPKENPSACLDLPSSSAKPVIADRIKWEHSPQFDPLPFFEDAIFRDAFIDPMRVRVPEENWPKIPRGKVHCSKTELLKLATKWDSKGACKVFRVDQIQWDECVGLFAVPKDESFDRLILNPRTVNSRMQSFSHYTRQLAPGSMFALVRLQPGQVLRISADDLAEMYYTIKIPEARAKRNSVGKNFQASELQHLSCFDPSIHHGRCVVALNALAMGDSWAVEFAQQSHCNVLSVLAGSMFEHERVCYRKPFPRSLFLEWLSIDDHIGLQIVTEQQLKDQVPLRDTTVFQNAGKAYKQVGLVQHPKKKQREVTEGIFLGAEIDGVQGFVSAPRHRICALMMCTVLVARQGMASPRLLSSLLGCWIHVLMFRRPILAVLSFAFSEGHGLPQNQLFKLRPETRNELLALACLGPVCLTDLRVELAPFIYCTDASPQGAGICRASEAESVVSELWRHSEQRGYYTQLLNQSAEILSTLGESFEDPCSHFDGSGWTESQLRIPCALPEGLLFDCIELFRGEGNWTLAHEHLGFSAHDGFDVKGDKLQFGDLLDDSVYHQVVSLAARGVCGDWHAGPPGKTYGTLRRPRLRSKIAPAGFDMSDSLTREHTLLALRTAFVMNLVYLTKRFFSVEQPGSSVMFHLDIFKRMVMSGCIITRMCFCSFGSPFKKPSKWLHNKPWMLALEQKCQCDPAVGHFVIEGSFTRDSVVSFNKLCRPSVEAVYGRSPCPGEMVSAFSASYPKLLCQKIAAGALQARQGYAPVIPLSAKLCSLQRIGLDFALPAGVQKTAVTEPRPFHEDPEWVEELADSLPFSELLRYRFKRQGHINVLETRVHKTLMKFCAKDHPNSRFLTLLDSRVALGATSKGRSSSRALCRVLQGSLGYIIGGGLYPGGLHISSGKNRSDAPSRNRPVPPASKDSPPWLIELRRGRHHNFDTVLEAAKVPKLCGRWLRLLLLLGGDIEPNPGPKQTKAQVPRGPIDMSVGFATATSRRMKICLAAFAEWLVSEFALDLNQLGWDYMAAPLALRAYGMHLFATGSPRYRFVYTITAMQDAFPHLRPFFSSCWQIDRKWQQHEPGECRPVLSPAILKAMTSLCLLWGWYRWLGVTLVGYLGMLHPAEFVNLVRSDLLLPADLLMDTTVFYVHIRNPKTSRFARKQHSKIDDKVVLDFVTHVFGKLPSDARLFGVSASAYRRRWDLVLAKLGVPSSMLVHGATPGVLRGSGATALYLQTEDLNLIQWRGRWAQLKTVEHYIQEVGAQSLLSTLSAETRDLVKLFADAAGPLLASFFVDSSKH